MSNDEQPNLFYIRSSSDPSGKWAAEVCFRGDDKMYTVVEVSDTQLLNFLRVAADIVSRRGGAKANTTTTKGSRIAHEIPL